MHFVWVKATEGSRFRDPRFAANWAGAHAAGSSSAPYHVVNMDSPGSDRAEEIVAVPSRTTSSTKSSTPLSGMTERSTSPTPSLPWSASQ
ncbi:GH25 family lysozyme [Gryllotalpicola protaetiae]|uniref:GH25 family lysozyme n=1 Tax=Gryllotalpicola protaetiae TaxID=2419771 RepID=UPI003CCC7EB3